MVISPDFYLLKRFSAVKACNTYIINVYLAVYNIQFKLGKTAMSIFIINATLPAILQQQNNTTQVGEKS